jgi:membrane associated rhomboid family serine protease
MVVLVVVFAIQCINDVYLKSLVESYLAVTPFAVTRGFVWQFFTFQFLHVDLWHLIGNLLGLWFFGRFVEHVMGRSRFLVAYFGAGAVGGLLQAILMVLFPNHFPVFVFGASAGVMGVFAIFCRIQGETEIRWNFILPIRAEVLLLITLGISLFFTVVPSPRGGPYSHAAHLGGLLAGIAWVKWRWHDELIALPGADWLARIKSLFRRQPVRHPQPSVARKPVESRREPAKVIEVTPEEFMAREVDPILEKIAAHGIHSLTAREKETLERARSKMTKR